MFSDLRSCQQLEKYNSTDIQDILYTHAVNVQLYVECATMHEILVQEAKRCK